MCVCECVCMYVCMLREVNGGRNLTFTRRIVKNVASRGFCPSVGRHRLIIIITRIITMTY